MSGRQTGHRGSFVLYDFPFSSASYRVRIALFLKAVPFHSQTVNLREGQQNMADYRHVNPAGLVPALALPDGRVLTQSLAIMRYLDSIAEPRLFPNDAADDADVSEMALSIACDIHPLNNLRVLNYLEDVLHVSADAKSAWYSRWVTDGFATLEALVQRHGGTYCFGDRITAADVCLVPQMANARRFKVDIAPFPRLCAIDARLRALSPFMQAAPVPHGKG